MNPPARTQVAYSALRLLLHLRWLTIVISLCGGVSALATQSGAGGTRAGGREYGVNLTFAVYQYDAQRSPEMQEMNRLSGTYSSAQEEMAFIKDKYKLQEMAVRHIRSVGLRTGETFNDAVLLGPEYMVFTLTPRDIVRG